MKEAKDRPKLSIEYFLLITRKYKERENKTVTRFNLKTVNEFSQFRYEIAAETELKEQTLRFDILGLCTPSISLPDSGPAGYICEYENLEGQYDVIVSKNRRIENKFSIKIGKNNVQLEKSPSNKFVEIMTNER